MARARNLTDADVAAIVSILDGWVDSLTWDSLIDSIERRLRVRYTRQALHKHVRIADAFSLRKEALRDDAGETPRLTSSPELQAAIERIARLEAENHRLEVENNRLLEQYARWIYNANVRGVSINALSQPLPTIDRGRTDASQKGRRLTRAE
jgi:hypothetical protein